MNGKGTGYDSDSDDGKGKKGKGKGYDSYDRKGKKDGKGMKGNGKSYDSGSDDGKGNGYRAICRHPKCLMCDDALRLAKVMHATPDVLEQTAPHLSTS